MKIFYLHKYVLNMKFIIHNFCKDFNLDKFNTVFRNNKNIFQQSLLVLDKNILIKFATKIYKFCK